MCTGSKWNRKTYWIRGGNIMKFYFVTKRDVNGNRYYLFINAENKTYTTQNYSIVPPTEAVEIGKRDMERMRKMCVANGYMELNARDWRDS
jgi:hypothetical protein